MSKFFTRNHRIRNTNALLAAIQGGVIVVDADRAIVKNAKGLVLKLRKNVFGYPQFQIRVEGVKYFFYVHKAVWCSVNGAVPAGFEIDHIDSDLDNPTISNLRLVTPEENLAARNYDKELAF